MAEPKSWARSSGSDGSTHGDDPSVNLRGLTSTCVPAARSAVRKSKDPIEYWFLRSTTDPINSLNPWSNSSKDRPQLVRGDQLTKDQALIVLGMSSKTRTKIVDLERKSVLDNFRRGRRRVEEERRRLSSSGYVGKEEMERRLRELEGEECLVHAAAQHLLNAHRAEELSRHFCWKPGVHPSREESRWRVLVMPKGRSVSILSKRMAENKVVVGEDEETTLVIEEDELVEMV